MQKIVNMIEDLLVLELVLQKITYHQGLKTWRLTGATVLRKDIEDRVYQKERELYVVLLYFF